MPSAGDRDRFAPEASPLHGRVCFLVGAPRSGTTWVQQLLAAHPQIAASTETHMFDGLGALLDNQDSGDFQLRGWVTKPEILTLTRGYADGVMLSLLEHIGQPDALVVEKSPNAPPVARHLAEVYPDAAFLHLVRDGRDAAYSLRQRFGTSLPLACRQWVSAVTDVREHLSTLRYLELRYEDIAGDPLASLVHIYRWLGVADPDSFAKTAVAGVDLPVNTDPSVSHKAGARRNAWPRWLGPLLVQETSPALVELGYVAPSRARLTNVVVRAIAPLWRGWERSAGRRFAPATYVERRRQRRVDASLAVTDELFRAIRAQDAAAARRLVAETAVLDLDGVRLAEEPVAEQLLRLTDGWDVHARWAVAGNSMAELHPPDGGRAAVRFKIDGRQVVAVEITTTDLAFHAPSPPRQSA